jgi:hypothetical protein
MSKSNHRDTGSVPSTSRTGVDDFDDDALFDGKTLMFARGTLPPTQLPLQPPAPGEEITRVCSPTELADSLATMASIEASDVAATLIIPLDKPVPEILDAGREPDPGKTEKGLPRYIEATDRGRVVRLVRTRRLLALIVWVGLGTAALYGGIFRLF